MGKDFWKQSVEEFNKEHNLTLHYGIHSFANTPNGRRMLFLEKYKGPITILFIIIIIIIFQIIN